MADIADKTPEQEEKPKRRYTRKKKTEDTEQASLGLEESETKAASKAKTSSKAWELIKQQKTL